MLLAVALGSWSVQDPSFSHATNAPVRNLLGLPGAIVSDLLMQLLGIAAVALVLPIAIWGWRLTTHRPLYRERLRLAIWLLAVLLAASFASCLPRTASWPLPAGLGGVFGDSLLRLSVLVAGNGVLGLTRIVIGIVAGVGALVTFAIALGMAWRGPGEDEDDQTEIATTDDEHERRSISLGAITHGLLSLKSRLARIFTRRAALPRKVPNAARLRTEPQFEDYHAALRDLEGEAEDGESDEQDEDAAATRRKPRATARASRRSSGGYVLPGLEFLTAPKAT
ncbi:MAG TPA: DNA translocase FtsK 4TM domain-containing protein, partial [Xanthobacteraceae bacterium]|nr:DNA translocase FtsK 4TM domain-containing protein [Xanthobacteraceae bacterium]